MDSKELSNGWVLSGKWGPNKKSMMTCETCIFKGDVSLDVGGEGRTYGYGLHVHSMVEGSDVKIGFFTS